MVMERSMMLGVSSFFRLFFPFYSRGWENCFAYIFLSRSRNRRLAFTWLSFWIYSFNCLEQNGKELGNISERREHLWCTLGKWLVGSGLMDIYSIIFTICQVMRIEKCFCLLVCLFLGNISERGMGWNRFS